MYFTYTLKLPYFRVLFQGTLSIIVTWRVSRVPGKFCFRKSEFTFRHSVNEQNSVTDRLVGRSQPNLSPKLEPIHRTV